MGRVSSLKKPQKLRLHGIGLLAVDRRIRISEVASARCCLKTAEFLERRYKSLGDLIDSNVVCHGVVVLRMGANSAVNYRQQLLSQILT